MIPELEELNIGEELEEIEYPSRTFSVDFENKKINGIIDDFESAKQALYFILKTAQYEYEIFDENYGLYTKDLIGKPINYAYSELKRRIPEAVLRDNRFSYVNNFSFEKGQKRDSILLHFTVGTQYKDIDVEAAFDLEGGNRHVREYDI